MQLSKSDQWLLENRKNAEALSRRIVAVSNKRRLALVAMWLLVVPAVVLAILSFAADTTALAAFLVAVSALQLTAYARYDVDVKMMLLAKADLDEASATSNMEETATQETLR